MRWVLGGVVVVLLGAAVAWFGQRSLIYLPDRTEVPPTAGLVRGTGIEGRDVTLRTSDGLELRASYVEADPACGYTVLITPGNGGNRASRMPLVTGLAELGLGVLALDYRGYGGNPGRPSEEGTRADARAARDFLVDEAGVAPQRLVLFGESLGAAVAADLAAEHPPAALLLRSPFTSLGAVARSNYGVPAGPVLRDEYDVLAAVRTLGERAPRTPVAVLLGTADGIVPPAQTREVADAAEDAGLAVRRTELAGAGHNDAELVHGPAVLAAVRRLVTAAGGTCGQGS